MSASAVLTHELPIFSLPEPSGPYGVGTFEYSITDDSRKERYSPTRNRELYVEVWYPAEKSALGDFPVRTLFQELYEGDYTRQSLLFGYLRHIPTHSHVHAPVAAPDDGPFPVLLFNHALELGFTSSEPIVDGAFGKPRVCDLQHRSPVSIVEGKPRQCRNGHDGQ